jgi:acetolactate synthase small subunit
MHLLLLTANRFGVLARITAIVSSTGVNIDTAAAYPISGADLSVVHLSLQADRIVVQRAARKLSRLVDVVEVRIDEEKSQVSIDFGKLVRATRVLEQTAEQVLT